jgi:hypothetical protein
MAQSIRVHLTAAQKARLAGTAGSRQTTEAASRALGKSAEVTDSADLTGAKNLSGTGGDLTGADKTPRATSVIPLP